MNMHRFRFSVITTTRTEIPGTTLSEGLFSTAGDIISDHRCRLLPENADIDLLEVQPPLVVKCWSDSFDSFWL